MARLPDQPTVTIVGRPNVGKSTLFNRLVGRRRALVGDEPGITRDRIYGMAHWAGRDFRVVDTGGILPGAKEIIPSEIFRQARVALDQADVIVMVVDGRTELAAPDRDLARLLLRSGKPVFLAVNKIDVPALEAQAENYRQLGLKHLVPVSAEHGSGVAELLDQIMRALPPRHAAGEAEHAGETQGTSVAVAGDRRPTTDDAFADDQRPTARDEIKVAIIGRPNVGKSTLLNRLTGADRAVVSPVPGTTRDAVDEIVTRDGQVLRFIDTAGIRRKGRTELMAEKLSVVMARKHLQSADIALLMIDGSEGVTALDANIAGYAHQSGRSVVLVVNKWDLVQQRARELGERRLASRGAHTARRAKLRPADPQRYEQEARHSLKFLGYAPMVFVSASSGRNVEKIFELVKQVAAERRKRVSTGEMNRFLKHVDFDRAPAPFSKQVKIFYMTQASTSPPTFVIFTDRDVKLHFSYERFLENQVRRAFGFVGTPIRIINRAREEKPGQRGR
ncbi:MAG TPA: ribosome biogenesis GTPase Der [Terriglobales bacterium]|nr:ribosome biogenesis GTPase Der [Terriglobales bacterium]